jgi:hypothetical protein
MSAALIDADHAAMMLGGASISVSSCSADGRPSVARAAGCSLSADRRQLRVMLSASQSAQVLAHVHERGMVAIVFDIPSTHRAIQLKATDATVVAGTHEDMEVVMRYRDSFVEELLPLGFNTALVLAILDFPPDDLAVLTLTPSAAFSQTPGPQAGQALKVLA